MNKQTNKKTLQGQHVPTRMWSKGNTPILLVGMETCMSTINLVFSQKFGNSPISTISQGHLLTYVH